MAPRSPHPDHVAARQKALAVARLSLENRSTSVGELAREHGVDRSQVTTARAILDWGTPEEIALIEEGSAGLRAVYDKVAARRTQTDARKKRRPIHTAETVARRKADAQVWEKLRAGISSINSMPTPNDVVAMVRENNSRSNFIDANILDALKWITEFSDAWTQ